MVFFTVAENIYKLSCAISRIKFRLKTFHYHSSLGQRYIFVIKLKMWSKSILFPIFYISCKSKQAARQASCLIFQVLAMVMYFSKSRHI